MKKLLLAGALALSLGACATSNIDEQIVQVQQQTRAICAFVPTVTTVAKIIASLTGGVDAINLIGTAAQGICTAVTTQPLAEGPGKRQPEAFGVKIEGHFVR